MTGLVDYGMGNLRSVEKALIKVGGKVRMVRTADDFKGIDRIVLPGVGAFTDCMENLDRQGLTVPLKAWITSKKPFLGICLGYQALFEQSEEGNPPSSARQTTARRPLKDNGNGGAEGLGIFKGKVVRFKEGELKVPQIGWNRIEIKEPACPLLKGIADGSYVYFVHSYFPEPSDSSLISTKTEYGIEFASMVWKENVFACQFHPEKSQKVGLKMLENFVKL